MFGLFSCLSEQRANVCEKSASFLYSSPSSSGTYSCSVPLLPVTCVQLIFCSVGLLSISNSTLSLPLSLSLFTTDLKERESAKYTALEKETRAQLTDSENDRLPPPPPPSPPLLPLSYLYVSSRPFPHHKQYSFPLRLTANFV